ncbi:acetolactate decarboxylase [Aspergillus clavatus NRRL 1]|uniref:Alpha-acetolactate decarboxylase n=1 Tax=Aspergillus clavatus (strain ATCC 1007 / CBS 513.65 / DSM 816 / NCTC 3887 / NRRL 1 / QM 1276 / 107) TaxID=344612 RepID=A1CLH4_ASPCL|nr:alpha-acetolactate decarboxylase, putative [Aspergillus clavatus NRRL 1]EAW09998.1 alpha-acetolactate decarboxylase, putative [Aspergillus clavatus NRRL 1]
MANIVYQYSVLSALMQGIADGGITAAQLLTHGDHGLGTVSHMDGEIVIVDGEAYHFTSDHRLRPVQPTDTLPFAMATRFQPTWSNPVHDLTMDSLSAALAPLLPSRQNSFLSIRMDGSFRKILFRVVPAQSVPGEPLGALAKRQDLTTHVAVCGTLFGFYSPPFTTGFSVAGFHLHFLSHDRRMGGHVLSFDAEEGELKAAVANQYQVEFPQSESFHQEPIRAFVETEIHQAEGTSGSD